MRRCIVVRCAVQLAAALREVVQRAPVSGIPLEDVEAEIKERMQAATAGDETSESSLSWRKALPEVNATHFVSGAKLYPCNWEETMRKVAAAIPYEGVTEKKLVEEIIEQESRFSSAADSLGEPISKWVQRRFPSILRVSRSAANGMPIYHAVGEPLSPEAECINRVLQLLGREKLPVCTDVDLIVPLLPVSMSPKKGNWLRFFESESVRKHFDVEVEAFVRVSPDRSPSTVFVDATSVEVARVDAILAAKGILDSLCVVKVFRRPDDPAWAADDIIVQSFLEPEHAIGAAIASMGTRNDVKVYVLCGDEAKERYAAALGDLLGQEEAMVTICTPTSDEEASTKKSEKLDALQKQSKEQITAAVTALQNACSEGVQPVRIAVAIGNRLTPGQVSNSFPVICLIDAMTTMQEEACVVGVLGEFWRIAPSLFTNYAKVADKMLQEKVSRAVKRWSSKKVFPSTSGERLLRCISGKEISEIDSEAAHHGVDDTATNSNSKNLSHSGDVAKDAKKEQFTRAEVSGFCAILQSCMKMIEKLPPHRASMYLEVVQKEKLLRTPSKSALLFFQGLHAELGRESALYNSNLVKSEHQTTHEVSGSVDTKAALGNLLDKLSKEQNFSADASAAAAGGRKDLTFNVIRYTSPMQSDIFQRLSVAQRAGFGEWHRRAKNEYHYPKKESNNRRVFRAPAGSKPGTRNWFPSGEQWISETDMAALRLWAPKETDQERESSNVYNVARKRERDA